MSVTVSTGGWTRPDPKPGQATPEPRPVSAPAQPAGIIMTVNEAAQRARVGRSLIFEAIAAGELRARKLHGRTIILEADFNAFINALPIATGKRRP